MERNRSAADAGAVDRLEAAPRDQQSRNDVSWYARNPNLLVAAASVPFPYRPGMMIPWMDQPSDTVGVKNPSIPGIMVFNWWPTVGYSQLATDPASIVGKEIFAKVREKFSGSIDADAPDFVIYTMALDSIFSYIAWLKRIYRVLTAYTSENHYIPDGLLRAMGFSDISISDLKEHRMQFYQIINELVYMTRKFNIPAVFDIINRHYWLNDNVYMDAESINSQFYLFNCTRYYQFGLVDDPQGNKVGGLTMVNVVIPNADVAEYLFTYGRTLIDALAGSDDAYIISGYLMRAYEGTPAFAVDELSMDEKLIPHYDPEVLMQIENASPLMIGPTYSTAATVTNDVSQDPTTNAILCVPHLSGTKPSWYNSVVWNPENTLSIRSEAPTAADVTIATRLKMGIKNDKSTATAFDYDIVCGSEILESIQLCYYDNTVGQTTRSMGKLTLLGLNFIGPNQGSMAIVYALVLMQSFDWHPILRYIVQENTAGTLFDALIAGDLHNSTILTNEVLEQINRVCLYSEFNAYGQL